MAIIKRAGRGGWMAAAFLSIIGAGPMAVAQDASPPITLAEAIAASLAHSTSVSEAQSAYRAARARTGEDASRQLPQLGFLGTATRFDNRTTVSLPGMSAPFQVAPNNEEALTLALTQDLDVSGGLGLTVAQARLNARAAQYGVQAVTSDQTLATTTAYYAVLRAEQNVGVAQASLDAYKEQQATTTRLYKGGVGQRIDVDRADSQVAEAESEDVRRQNELNSARSTMNDLLGRPLDQALVLVEPVVGLTSTPAPPPPARTNIGPQEEGSPNDDRRFLIALAQERRPEALEATVEVLAAKRGIQIARTTSYPDVQVSLTGSRYPTTSFEEPRQNVAALTLSVAIPIFDGGLAREKVHEAREGVAYALAQQDRIRRDIALQVQNAALDIDTARKREAAAEADVTAATAARRLAQQRFESQVGLYIEVTDAQSALTAAQAAKVQATYDLLTAQAQLAHAVGKA